MSSWFKKYRYNHNAKLRLFCFPYAGGSANIFSNWLEKLPVDIDLLAIQSPGRGSRFSESPIGCLKTKVQAAYKEILAFTDVPYIFLGHSNGALLCYELARELQKSGNANLRHIILSAKRAPHLPERKESIHHLPQSEFISKLKEYDFTPDEVLQNDELMELFSPMLRADFSLSETLDFDSSYQLESDATLFWGKKDVDVPYEDVMAWRKLINGNVGEVEFSEGHFFINKQEEKFLSQVNKVIQQVSPILC